MSGVIASLLLASVAVSTGEQCSVDNLPVFEDQLSDHDRFQAIVPAYRVQCSGRVTEWKAYIQPGRSANEQYYIQFQVWRPTGSTDGCYTLVGYNIPLHDVSAAMTETMTEKESVEDRSDEDSDSEASDSEDIIDTEGFLSPSGDSSDPLRRCVELSVRENEQIEVQQGDVVGYYVDRFMAGNDRSDGGIQWMQNSNAVVVYYRYDLPREDIRPAYTIGGPGANACGFDIDSGDGDSNTLSISASAAPMISLNIVTSMLQLTSTSAPSDPSSMHPPPLSVSTSTPSLTSSPCAILNTTTSSACMYSSGELGMSESDVTVAEGPYITVGVSVALLIIISATLLVVILLLWFRKERRKQTKLVDNVAYNIHDCEIKNDANEAYNAVETNVITTTNAAYTATSVQSTQMSVVDVTTVTNEAYLAAGFSSSTNPAYGTAQIGDDSTGAEADTILEYDYPRQDI